MSWRAARLQQLAELGDTEACIAQDGTQCPGLQLSMIRHGHRPAICVVRVTQTDVTSSLADDLVADLAQCRDDLAS